MAKFLEQKSTRTSDFGTNVSAPTPVPNCFQVPKQVPREECTNVPKQVPKQQVTLTGNNIETTDRWSQQEQTKTVGQEAAAQFTPSIHHLTYQKISLLSLK